MSFRIAMDYVAHTNICLNELTLEASSLSSQRSFFTFFLHFPDVFAHMHVYM